MAWRTRFRNLFRGGQLERDLDEELQFHLDARAHDNIVCGMSDQEAREDAARRFGNRTLAMERTLDADMLVWLETLWRDFAFACRGLRKNPGFTMIAVLVLALGIGANTAVFTVVNGVLLRPLPFREPSRLFLISCTPRHSIFAQEPALSDRDYLAFRKYDHFFESIATLATHPVTLTRAGDPTVLNMADVTEDFFRVLRVNPIMGRHFIPQPGTDTDSVLLSDSLWRSRFGANRAILGTPIMLDGAKFTVIGIMPPEFTFQGADLWTRIEVRIDPHRSFMRPVVGRLQPGVSSQRALAELQAFAASRQLLPGEHPDDFISQILPLQDLVVTNIRNQLLLLAGAVAFVFLIACANVANLLLMRGASRRHEISVRAALGASRLRLIRQMLTESTLLSLAGGTMAVFLAMFGVHALLALAPPGKIPRTADIHLDASVLAFTLSLSLLTGIGFGLIPACQTTRRELPDDLSEGSHKITARHERLRAVLVTAEIALALVLLTGAGLLVKSFLRMRAVDPGFRSDNVITAQVDLPESRYRKAIQMQSILQRSLERLRALPRVESAAAVNWIPLRQFLIRGDFQLEGGRKLPPGFMVDKPVISAGYFRTMGIRLLKGRELDEHDNASAPGVAIISASVARILWPQGDALGRRISMEDNPRPQDWLTIVGVAEDVRQEALTDKPGAAVYLPYLQVNQPFFLNHMNFVLRTPANQAVVVPGIRDVIHSADPELPTESIISMESILAQSISEPQFQARLITTFSFLALSLAAVGIYGVLARSVVERTHEIGIRMAMGAKESDVIGMVLKRTLVLVLTGAVIGTAAATILTQVLTKTLYDVSPEDPATYVTSLLILAGVSIIAAWVPTRRAAKVYPLVALRHE